VKAILIDDEIQAREALRKILEDNCRDVTIVAEADTKERAEELLKNTTVDLVFLDIALPDGDGFDLIPVIKDLGLKIIFTTAHNEYALQAFRVSAIDFLLKPLDPVELCAAVDKVRHMVENDHFIMLNALISNLDSRDVNLKKIVLKTSESIHIIDISDIIRLESDCNYTRFFLSSRPPILVSKTLKDYEDILLNSGFIRSHNSHLVNFNYISRFDKADGGSLVMKDGVKIPVSVRKRDALMDYLNKFTLKGE
jgi:two-component system, LytTR family, response regulator